MADIMQNLIACALTGWNMRASEARLRPIPILGLKGDPNAFPALSSRASLPGILAKRRR